MRTKRHPLLLRGRCVWRFGSAIQPHALDHPRSMLPTRGEGGGEVGEGSLWGEREGNVVCGVFNGLTNPFFHVWLWTGHTARISNLSHHHHTNSAMMGGRMERVQPTPTGLEEGEETQVASASLMSAVWSSWVGLMTRGGHVATVIPGSTVVTAGVERVWGQVVIPKRKQ